MSSRAHQPASAIGAAPAVDDAPATPGLDIDALFQRVSGDAGARITVLTPNRRLAAEFIRRHDASCLAAGESAWSAPDVLPFGAFVQRLYEDALYSGLGVELPLLLEAAQEQCLWEDIVAKSEAGATLLSPSGTAAACAQAWSLAHGWRLIERMRMVPLDADARAFLGWSAEYDKRCRRERLVDVARLPDLVAGHAAHPALARPALIVLHGFDIVSPQQRGFLRALGDAGVAMAASEEPTGPVAATRVPCATARDERLAAARWARAQLEADPGARVGIVVPDIAATRAAWKRALTQVCAPAAQLPPAPAAAPPDSPRIARFTSPAGADAPLPFNISLGLPLAEVPLVADALLVLELAGGAKLGFERIGALLRSPYLDGAIGEHAARARLEAQLRRTAAPDLTLGALVVAMSRVRDHACPRLAEQLGVLLAWSRERLGGTRAPSAWSETLGELLRAAGFPGERTLDSHEYQAAARLHERIASMASLDRVAPRLRYAAAAARLRRMAADALFQPEASDEPIQVLGVLESAGLRFDALWVSGLTDEAWPMPARPDPFIPVFLQREAGVPQASAARSMELDRRITEGWLHAAPRVVVSHPLREQDRELRPSALVSAIAVRAVQGDATPPARDPLWRDLLHASRAEERIDEAQVALEGVSAPGGTALFADQAACPFRAFAAHRLHAEPLAAPGGALDAGERGTLVHATLHRVWQVLGNSDALGRMIATGSHDGHTLDEWLRGAARHAIERLRGRRADALPGRQVELEERRLAALARAWLDVEVTRAPFAVAGLEAKRILRAGGIEVEARLDRMDHVPGLGEVVIDYKTGSGKAGPAAWMGERPDEPQLPLYAIGVQADGGDAAAVVFARVRAGEMKFDGVARNSEVEPGVPALRGVKTLQDHKSGKEHADWPSLLAHWRSRMDALGEEIASGVAAVDPKKGGTTCQRCDLQPLCRIAERADWGLVEEEADEAPDQGGGGEDAA
jgi:ATP-dependent helicase/nuclease subunit B